MGDLRKKTNFDVIKEMSAEQFAMILASFKGSCNFCFQNMAKCVNSDCDCYEEMLKYLNTEVEENGNAESIN